MAAPVAGLYIGVTADVARASAGFDSLSRGIDRFRQRTDANVRHVERRFQGMAATLRGINLGGIGGALGLGALAGGGGLLAIRNIASEMAKIGDQADRIGISTTELQRLGHVAERTGSSKETLARGMEFFAQKIAEAGTGTGEFLKVLEANGIALRNQDGSLRSSSDLLKDWSNLVRNAKNPADQLRLAAIAMGRSAGPELVTMLRQGADGINTLGDKARVFSEDRIRDMQRVDANFKDLAETVGFTFKSAVLEAAGAVATLWERWNQGSRIAAGEVAAIEARLVELRQKLNEAENSNRMLSGVRIQLLKNEIELMEQKLALAKAAAGVSAPSSSPSSSPAAPPRATIIPTSGSGTTALDEYQRMTRTIAERTAELQRQQSVLGASTYEQARSRAELELYNAAQRAGVEVDVRRRAEIGNLSHAYAQHAVILEESQKSLAEMRAASQKFGDAMGNALTSILVDGENAGEAMKKLAIEIVKATIKALIMKAIMAAFNPGGFSGGSVGTMSGGSFVPSMTDPWAGLSMAKGGVFGSGRHIPFANGGVFRGPTVFPFAKGGAMATGVLGEAGHEAIMPLTRTASGKLGVMAEGVRNGGGGEVKIEIINNAGAPITEGGSRREGGVDIQRIIVGAVMEDVAKGGGIARQLEGQYGIRRNLR